MNKFANGRKINNLSPLTSWFRRRRLVTRLCELDDRMLEDIGIQRFQIKEVAAAAFPKFSLKAYVASVVATIRKNAKVRRDERLLASFDNRMLADIGLWPGDLRGEKPVHVTSGRPVIAEPVVSAAHTIESVYTVADQTPTPVNDDRHSIAA